MFYLQAYFHCELPVFVKLEWHSSKSQILLECNDFLLIYLGDLFREVTQSLLFDKKAVGLKMLIWSKMDSIPVWV